MRLGLAPRCRRTNSPGGSPSPPLWEELCGVAGASPVTPRRLLRYGQRAEPSKGAGRTLDLLSCDLAGLGGGARPVGRHPCHC
jgi:hypothetical protein